MDPAFVVFALVTAAFLVFAVRVLWENRPGGNGS